MRDSPLMNNNVGGALVLLVVWVFVQKLMKRRSDNGGFPQGPPAWPIIGHLHLLLRSGRCIHDTLADLAHQHGPIFSLRLGSRPAVVISSAALAKELLTTHDKTFANRPPYVVANTLFYGYNSAVAFSSYNPHWLMIRKICSFELFTAKRLHHLEYVRQEEVRGLLRTILQASQAGTHAVDVGQSVAHMSSHTITRLVQSKTATSRRGDHAGSLSALILRVETKVAPTLGDLIPWLRFLDLFQTRSMKDLHDCLDKIIDTVIRERRQLMTTHPQHELPHDFLQVLLSKEAGSDGELLTTQEIKGIMLDIFVGGIHTSSTGIEWAMAELLRNPSCLGKLRDEIDATIGKGDKLVSDEDLPKLPYLLNTIKEVLRLHPAGPLLFPRISSKECKLGGYTLPKNTHAFVNVYAIGRDPQVWEKPETFCPERFEGKDMDVRGQHYELLPFGAGRRMCPGLRLGLSTLQVTLGNLVKTFDWELPEGQSSASIDMSEKRGIGNVKATPVLAIPRPRFSF